MRPPHSLPPWVAPSQTKTNSFAAIPKQMPSPSPVLAAIKLELRELEATAATLRDLDEDELAELDPQIVALRETLRAGQDVEPTGVVSRP